MTSLVKTKFDEYREASGAVTEVSYLGKIEVIAIGKASERAMAIAQLVGNHELYGIASDIRDLQRVLEVRVMHELKKQKARYRAACAELDAAHVTEGRSSVIEARFSEHQVEGNGREPCLVCGGEVVVVHGSDGTSHYGHRED